jgi:heat shock protein HslJ
VSQFVIDPSALHDLDASCTASLFPIDFTYPPLTPADLFGVELTATSVYAAVSGETVTIPEGSSYTLTFVDGENLSIVADCNTVMASYTTGDENAIEITLGASTRAACPEGSLADDFLAVLEAATSARVIKNEGQIAVSFTADDGSLVVFTGTR